MMTIRFLLLAVGLAGAVGCQSDKPAKVPSAVPPKGGPTAGNGMSLAAPTGMPGMPGIPSPAARSAPTT